MEIEVGSFVSRKSYGFDLVFKVEKVKKNAAVLRSFRVRLMADASLDDLVVIDKKDVKNMKRELLIESIDCIKRQQKHFAISSGVFRNNSPYDTYREYPVKVLHIDGDKDYLELSLSNYRNLNLNVQGFYIPEKGQPEKTKTFIENYKPDILVITGHDGELNGRLYYTSDYFVKAVDYARKIKPNLDDLVIYAGACQSDYQRLINSGANFASSPANKLIHFLDPILIVEKVAFTPINEIISVKDVINSTITGEGGIGGVETRGKLRYCYP